MIETDEVFLVINDSMEIEFRDRTVAVSAGELFVIQKGVEHCTRAHEECQALLIEPQDLVNTGDAESELTAANDIWI
ncbi:hypothetical protein [cf. Phormidesmis sp. LEGE 11477]|uniref:hypothetical protein n=1 Tax=cf. Phormidesmis sp. LEGE 11477 TaxID=1828680 RepID=UPI001881EF92|nr:hypothetical protein [cf. Phormidesmis sp. LEGE 11477]MBE9064648.1 hypothetical protein [cf. Phormidesmis sp. LEGE 11477]